MEISLRNDDRVGKPRSEMHFSDSDYLSFPIEFSEDSIDMVNIVEHNITFSQSVFQFPDSLDLKHNFFLEQFFDLCN